MRIVSEIIDGLGRKFTFFANKEAAGFTHVPSGYCSALWINVIF